MLQRLRHAVGWGPAAPAAGTRVDFQVCARLGHGQTLYLVGDAPALGGSVDAVPSPVATGSSENGVALVTTPDLYPIWYNLEPLVLPAGSSVRYRYAVCSGAKFLRYEQVADGQVVTRELQMDDEYVQAQDTLDAPAMGPASDAGGEVAVDAPDATGSAAMDAEALTSPSFWGVIPRLSSGQAFVDRPASGNEDAGGIGTFWTHRSSSTSSRRPASSRPLTDTIVEEDEGGDVAMEAAGDDDDNDRNEGEEGKSQQTPRSPVTSQHHVRPLTGSSYSLSGRRLSDPPNMSMSVEDMPRGELMSSPRKLRGRSVSEDSNKAPQQVTIESTDGVIIMVYRLPVLVHRTPEGNYHIEWEDDNLVCPSGLLKESYRESNWDRVSSMRLTWVGTVHCSSVIPREDEERLTRQLEDFHCVPVFLHEPLAQTFHSYCYDTLWPVFHNIVDIYGALPTRWWNPGQQKNAWSSYKNVNRIFVNKVIEVYNEGDLVWAHGLHLLVAPSFLVRRLPNVNVGLFLHTPFPSSEIFRTLSVRADLLRGVLAADHIGFHLYEHARHFLTSCRRVLGLKYSAQSGGYVGVEYSGRMVMLTISHIGIEPTFMNVIGQNAQVVTDTQALMRKYEADKRMVFVSVDRVERLKGILLKIGAIELFFASHPEWLDKVQIVQIGIVDTSNPSPERKSVRREILTSVARINARFSQGRAEPIFVYSEVENTDMASRLPLWTLGHVLLTTTVRDAVNLYPFEFIFAHELSKKPGVVIVSEFSGSSRVLTGSVGVNPWKRLEIVQAMELAMTMTDEEKLARHHKDLEYITNNTRTKWAERILVDLKRTKKQAAEGEHMGYGLGLGFRMLEFNAGFKLLDTEAIAKAYRETYRRVLLFDYGNTLKLEERGANNFSKYLDIKSSGNDSCVLASESDTPPASPELLAMLSKLCADPRNTVFVLSGKERGDLEKTLGSVKGLGLAAEHGYLYKWGSKQNSSDEEDVWLCTKENFDDSWKDVTHAVMDIYTQRTHGTYIELKGSALLWQYRDADPEFGQLQAKELHDQLTQVLEHFQVEVITGTDYLEVRPEGVDKGVIVDRILSTIESTNGGYADFILCIGDDLSDEFMFQYLEDVRSRPKLFTVTVGKKPSAAKYYVNDVDQVLEIIQAMTKVSSVTKRNLSMNDLRLIDKNLPAPYVVCGMFDAGWSRI